MLRKFGNILIETDEVSALIGRLLVMKNGKTHGIDVESANAMREAFTSHPFITHHSSLLTLPTHPLAKRRYPLAKRSERKRRPLTRPEPKNAPEPR